jgi:16S rRNA (uracil1498-N3)-methyltransferase
MTLPLRVFIQPLREGAVLLDPATSRYVTRVHRLRKGAAFVAFDPVAQQEAQAVLVHAGRDRARCRLSHPRPALCISPLRATLVQAMGKANKPDRVVRDATALGVHELVLVQAQRSMAHPSERGRVRRQQRWQRLAIEAARQCGRGDLPVIVGPVGWHEALARTSGCAGPKLCLDPAAASGLAQVLRDWQPTDPVVLLVGPEGGWSAGELESARSAGFVAVRMGPFVLRTETAATAVLAALLSRL